MQSTFLTIQGIPLRFPLTNESKTKETRYLPSFESFDHTGTSSRFNVKSTSGGFRNRQSLTLCEELQHLIDLFGFRLVFNNQKKARLAILKLGLDWE